MIKGSTNSGFEFEISDSALNDWELLELIDEIDEKPTAMIRIAKKLLGEEKYLLLKKHCTFEGKVLMDKMMTEVTEIMKTNSAKNS